MKELRRRFFGFALIPALSMLASLVLLPLISRYDGSVGWSSVAVGQSVGALVSVVGGMAWPVVGAQRVVESETEDARKKLFVLSVLSRGLIIGLLCVLLIPVILVVGRQIDRAVASLFLVVAAFNGLSASWYFTGTGNPRPLIVNEGLTRFAGYVVAVVLMLVTRSTLSYAISAMFFSCVSILLNWASIVGLHDAPSVKRSEVMSVIGEQLLGGSSRLASSAHSFGSTALLALFMPAALGLFSAIDNVFKSGCNAVGFLPSVFFHWMQDTDVLKVRRKRQRLSLAACLSAGALVIVGWAFVGPSLMRFFYQGAMEFSYAAVFAVGVSVALVLMVNSICMLIVVPAHLESVFFRTDLLLSLVGVLSVLPLAYHGGALAAFLSYAMAAVLKICILLVCVLNRRPSVWG